ncbi:MAG: 50S ribosomal protein L9 [Patescibacteria group bacterium]|nr:50S ribosomal protein L9 [Patescibacteria group bacterium]
MKVILIKDARDLGSVGDIKDVANGYARNFLIPGGFVKVATKNAIKQEEELKIKKEEQAKENLKGAEEVARKLEGVSVAIKSKADEAGKLYAGIKTEEISKALEGKGFKVDKNKIVIEGPIKEVGDYEVIVNLEHGLEAKIGVIVESDK